MNLLYLKKFNNYYNRKVKYYKDADEYISLSEDYAFNSGVDFNPGDNINTVKVANLGAINFSPDYLLVLDETDSKNIISRWYVLEMKRERNGQYTINLKRDLLADYFEELKTSPMFVYKGNLSANSPLIYNQEQMIVNQIKKEEVPIKDFTDTSWIVGYVSNQAFTESPEFEVINTGDLNNVVSIESLGITLEDSSAPEAGGYLHRIQEVAVQIEVQAMWNVSKWIFGYFDANWYNKLIACNINLETNVVSDPYESDIKLTPRLPAIMGQEFIKPNYDEVVAAYKRSMQTRLSAIRNGLDAYFNALNIDPATLEEYQEVYALQGKIVRSNETGLYYKLNIGTRQSTTVEENLASTDPSELSLYQAIGGVASLTASATNLRNVFSEEHCAQIRYTKTKIDISLTPLQGSGTAKTKIKSSHRLLEDAPYSMFCLRNTPLNLTLAIKIAEQIGDKNAHDLQLLPYCPVPTKIEMDNGVAIPNGEAEEEKDFFFITDENDEKIDYVYFATSSQGSFVVDKSIIVGNSPLEIKVANGCDSYRLCSPNYNGIFEFNAAKNGGVDYFEVSYTYKPYQPYIHVNPNFKKLYGGDFNDARGLVCGGDFSLPRTSEAWANYELQNKNYARIFDKQIETLDKENQLNLLSQGIATPINALSTGVAVGSLGGPIAGAAAGIGSLVGGIADIAIGQSKFQNRRQESIDLFNMNLQNIKALPTGLSKIGAYNIDNKIFPFLEVYSCTDEEKEAFKLKIKYEAMTVGAIGTINDFIDAVDDYNFFKASPILLEGIADDFHLADAIAQELEKGVYL